MKQLLAKIGDNLCRWSWIWQLGMWLHDKTCERCRETR